MSRALKVGIFFVIGVVLFCVGLFLIGSRSQIFGNHFTVYTEFQNVDTLVSGSTVRVGGMNAGRVLGIQVPKNPSGKFRLTLSVDEKFRRIVRSDSLASIETEGMVGNKYVNIGQGTNRSPECDRCTLPSQEATSMASLFKEGQKLAGSLQSTINDLRPRVDTAIDNISSAAGHANSLIVALKPRVVNMAGNADAIVAGIRQGQGMAGKLLTDKTTAANFSATMADARQTTANFKATSQKIDSMVSTIQKSDLPAVHKTLANTESATAKINQAVTSLTGNNGHQQNTVQAIGDTIHQAQRATTNLADDTEAIKHNFFLRGFFHRRGFFDLQTLTPAKYFHSKFVRKPRVREWIPAAGLFTTGPNGTLEITDAGRKTLNRSMSSLVPYLPNNPIVVEAYTDTGAPDQQYIESRARALAVSDYLKSHFSLKADRVGIMPLGAYPPPKTGKKQWNGVCLVLVVEKQ